MKIAIVGPSPVPFRIGGAENLIWGLCDYINQHTEHQADIIKLPTKEFSFWDLIDSYYQYYKLDLNHFDMIITTKYPSWMVRHDNSVCWMLHTLRGLYDTYSTMSLPYEVEHGRNKKLDDLLLYMKKNEDPDTLDLFFDKLWTLRNDSSVPESYYSFPGPLIRLIVHYMDRYGLRGQKSLNAISNVVKERDGYFPPHSSVRVIYPPTVNRSCTTGDYKYIFMISRLDAPKRIDMLISAMKYVREDVQLLIAGTGPEKEKLENLADHDKRISFLGFISDEEADNYYANCLVVPYFPYDEDYGYITVEAMLHKKPVITTVDAGGPKEFVVNGETGFITEFEERAIAEKISFLVQHPDEARRMGENACQLVKKINWEDTVAQLLNTERFQDELATGEVATETSTDTDRESITVTSTFSVYPPQGGGQARIYNLYKNIAKYYNVEIVAFDAVDAKPEKKKIASHLTQNVIPKSLKHQQEESLIEAKVQIPVTDIVMFQLSGLTPEYGRALRKSMSNSCITVVSHPYLYPEVKENIGKGRFIYEAQDVEYIIKKGMLPRSEETDRLLQELYAQEKECCERSEFIMVCCEEDAHTIHELYHIPIEKMIVVPNGVDVHATGYTPVAERLKIKEKLGLSGEKLGIFMGSWHGPNLEACEEIFKIAEECHDTKFLLIGSQCLKFKGTSVPDNVGLLGLVSEEEKNRIFSAVDFAINPMMSGSGTNLKMFDYMAAGIPVITTKFGSRGIDNKDLFILSELDEIPDEIHNFDLRQNSERVFKARKYVEENFDWSVIANKLKTKLNSIGL